MVTFFSLIALAIAAYAAWRQWQVRTWRRLMAQPLTEAQREMIVSHIPLIKRLPEEFHVPLEGKINNFLRQVQILGCDGLEVTEAMRLSIAAQACLLIVNTPVWYSTLRTVLVYPSAFRTRQSSEEGWLVTEAQSVRLGESWDRGPVVLSWAHSKGGAINEFDGANVVLHEFAHQLDGLSGRTNGLPILRRTQSYQDWQTVFVDAYTRHVANTEAGRKTVMDGYGATNYEEFFAVAIETFFEKPKQLERDEPAVYQQLSALLALDPLSWRSASG